MKDENKIKAELIKESKTLRKEREKSALDDTTKHKQLEEKYQSFTKDILDASKVGIFILNSDFKVVWINNALENYFGLQREKIIGKDKRQLIKEKITKNRVYVRTMGRFFVLYFKDIIDRKSS